MSSRCESHSKLSHSKLNYLLIRVHAASEIIHFSKLKKMLFYNLFVLNSVFFYVGPDTDVFTLNTLLDQETEIIYVEPLTAFLNRKLITNFVGKHSKRFDELFECPSQKNIVLKHSKLKTLLHIIIKL